MMWTERTKPLKRYGVLGADGTKPGLGLIILLLSERVQTM
jgi:hypothetical protein